MEEKKKGKNLSSMITKSGPPYHIYVGKNFLYGNNIFFADIVCGKTNICYFCRRLIQF